MRDKLSKNAIDLWNNLSKFIPIEECGGLSYNIPPIPLCDRSDYDNIIVPNLIRCGAIPKDKLEIGKTYYGDCRNSNKATWNGEKFIYMREKWGSTFEEKINHFQDDNGYDVFVPITLCTI